MDRDPEIHLNIRRLTMISPLLKAKDEAYTSAWGGDDSDVIRYGNLGQSYVECLPQLSEIERASFFLAVEEIATQGSERNQTGVTTGLLESLCRAWDDEELSTEELWGRLGEESRAYCVAWNDFCGIPSPPVA